MNSIKPQISKEILSEAAQYARAKLEDDATGHDWWHVYRVTQMAKRLAHVVSADESICELASLFHDLIDEKLFANPSNELAHLQQWMEDRNLSAGTMHQINDIIQNLSYRSGAQPASLEGKVVQDADRLDALGAIGIARTFMYAGSKSSSLYDPSVPLELEISRNQYRAGNRSAIHHFYDKLLKLKDQLHLPASREIASKRHDVLVQYLDHFFLEWEAADYRK